LQAVAARASLGTPQRIDQQVAGDGPIGVQNQERQHRALLPTKLDGLAGRARLDGAKNPKRSRIGVPCGLSPTLLIRQRGVTASELDGSSSIARNPSERTMR
jgi:hypothetical protein